MGLGVAGRIDQHCVEAVTVMVEVDTAAGAGSRRTDQALVLLGQGCGPAAVGQGVEQVGVDGEGDAVRQVEAR